MSFLRTVACSAIVFVVGCGRPQKGDVVLPVGSVVSSGGGANNNSTSSSGPAGADSSASGTGGTSGNSGSNSGAGTGASVVPMTLDEAKAKCASCHQPGGSGAGVWSAANGTEADWKAFAAPAKNSVSAGRMPVGIPLSAEEKAKLIAYFDKLLGIVPPAGGGTSPGGTNPPPVVTQFTFESARVLCVGCHSSSAPQNVRETPYLETLDQWKVEKSEIRKEVRNGSMPMGKAMTQEERAALIKFIDSL
ncbi:MAG: c-type cytochrome [Silvanigrellaceae bacterium]